MKTRPVIPQKIIRSTAAKPRTARFLFLFATMFTVIGITPTASGQVRPTLSASGPDRDSQFHFSVSGAPGATYLVEASSDLATWTPVLTNTVSSAAYFDFVDSHLGDFPQRFYRIVPSSDHTLVAQNLFGTGPANNLFEDFRQDRVLVKPKPGITLSTLGEL